MKRARRLLSVGAGALVAGYVLVCGLLFGLQRELTFPAPTVERPVRDGGERVEVPGGTFFLWRHVAGGGPVVVHFHASGEQVADLSWLAQSWAREGVSFVAVEYPGYPGAGGSVSESAMVAAAQAALLHLTGPLQIDRSRLVLVGQSVGTGLAVTMAAAGWGKRLVLLSPSTSLPALAAESFPWLPTGLLLVDRFDSAARAPRLTQPTLVLHGALDSVVPVAMGRQLAAAIPGARFVEVEGAHHGDLLDRAAAQRALFAFAAPPGL